jgi:hypothetical protein
MRRCYRWNGYSPVPKHGHDKERVYPPTDNRSRDSLPRSVGSVLRKSGRTIKLDSAEKPPKTAKSPSFSGPKMRVKRSKMGFFSGIKIVDLFNGIIREFQHTGTNRNLDDRM